MKQLTNSSTIKINKRVRLLAMFAITATFLVGTVGCASTPAPTQQIAVSKAAVTQASRGDSNEYAPLELKSAREKMDRAELAMIEKKYPLAKRLAEEAEVDAKLAETKTSVAKAEKAIAEAQESNRVLRKEIKRTTTH